ncbi:MAG: hypothetical protein SF053_15020 [Bacteroidia bacterium]|nr:hypothetical protein [Bacteroidia bacterium]
MLDPRIDLYCHQFKRLKRANHIAPHKPILLISVCQAIGGRIIAAPFFTALPELVALFRYNWSLYVDTAHNPVFTLPFTKMDSEPFWKIVLNPGYQAINIRKVDIKSFNTLQQMISGVQLDAALFDLLQDRGQRVYMFVFGAAVFSGQILRGVSGWRWF